MTLGLRVKDGAALEKRLKAQLENAGALPRGVAARFDTGRVGAATLHALDVAGLPTGPMEATLAIAPNYVFVLTGGDVQRRVGAALAASGRAQPQAEALGQVTIALAPVLAYAERLADAFAIDADTVERIDAAGAVAADEPAATLALIARPIERGARYRLRADGGAVKTIAALMSAAPALEPAAGPPRRAPRGAPALAP
jgi:hypothetical protein